MKSLTQSRAALENPSHLAYCAIEEGDVCARARTGVDHQPPRRLAPVELGGRSEEILATVRASPGITLGNLLAKHPMGWGTLYHHLRRLRKAGLVRSEAHGRRRCLFPVSLEPRVVEELRTQTILRGKTAHRVYEAIRHHPGLDVAQLIERAGLSSRIVYYQVKRLVQAGLIQSDSSKRYTNLVPRDISQPTPPPLAEEPPPPARTLGKTFTTHQATKVQRVNLVSTQILPAIRQSLGISLRELSRQYPSLTLSQLRRDLRKSGEVRFEPIPGSFLVLPSSIPQELGHRLALLHTPKARAILHRIRQTPGQSSRTVRNGLGLRKNEFERYYRRLEDAGFIERRFVLGREALHPTTEAEQLLQQLNAHLEVPADG